MLEQIKDKSITSLLMLLLVVTLAFLLIRLIPGDPAEVMLGAYATPEQVAELRRALGLEEPLYVQYANYLVGVARGDLGESIRSRRSVSEEIGQALPYTLHLTIVGMLIAILVGMPLGSIGAYRRNRPIDHISMVFALLGYSIPSFWLALLLILAFSIRFSWFPMLGGGELNDWGSLGRHIVLPALSLGLRQAGLIARVTRSSMLEVLETDYVRTARAKGLIEQTVLWRHALKNAAIPIVTVIGLDVGVMLGGSVAVEIVFSRPGMGRMLVDAILARDYAVVQGSVFIWALIIIVVNFITDMTYTYFDPRIKFK